LRTTAFIKASIPNVNSDPGQREEALKLLTKGNDLWNSSKTNDAIEAYKKSLSIHQSGDAYYNLGNCYYSIGKIDDAKDCWESSLKFVSTRSDAHVNLGNIYALNLKDFKNANSHYEAALSINDSDGEVHYNYAAILDAQGNLEKCITHYQKARKLGMTIADKNLRNAMARLIANQSKKNQ
jgi:tetratricopeptide (TPR) repeat protein